MEKFNIEGWVIEVDIDKTSKYYFELSKEGYRECCLHCENYYYGITKASFDLNKFFDSLKIIPTETANLSELSKLENGKHLYEARYLLTGNIIVKPEGVEKISEDGCRHINPKQLPDGTQFYFTEKVNFPYAKLCPEPIIQLNIICEVPWVLKEMT